MHHVFYFKFLLAIVSLAACLVLIFWKAAWLERRPGWEIVVYYALRLGVLAVVLLKMHFGYPAENMSMYYYDAEIVLNGAVPNRDFFTLYGVLFPYWLAGAAWLWHDRFALIILIQVVEFAAVYVIFTQRTVPLTKRSFLIFALNPLVLLWIWLSIANQVMCLFAVAAAFALRSELARSVIFALTFASSKIFVLWTVAPALLCQRVRTWFYFAAALTVIYVPFLLIGSTGISFKATEASGYITDNTNHTGVLSMVGLIPVKDEVTLTRPVLAFTALLLLATGLVALAMRFKLGLGREKNSGAAERDIIFISVFATVLTMIYQAFATYTIPDYFLSMIILVPFLVQAKFWTTWDLVLIVVTCFWQSVVFLTWFHFDEFGNPLPRTSGLYVTILAIENVLTWWLCLRSAWRAYTYYAPQLRTAR